MNVERKKQSYVEMITTINIKSQVSLVLYHTSCISIQVISGCNMSKDFFLLLLLVFSLLLESEEDLSLLLAQHSCQEDDGVTLWLGDDMLVMLPFPSTLLYPFKPTTFISKMGSITHTVTSN